MKRFTKLLFSLLIPALLIYIAYPYVNLWRLDRALVGNDVAVESRLIDLTAIQGHVKASMKKETDRVIGKADDDVSRFFREGAKTLTDRAVAHMVDRAWVKTRLRRDGQPGEHKPFPSMLNHVRYAFFERWDLFSVRLGDLGDDPVHVHWRFKDWKWRVVAVYD